MFAELENLLSEAFTKIASGSESIAEKLAAASGLSTVSTSLESIQADTSTSVEQKILAAYNLGKGV